MVSRSRRTSSTRPSRTPGQVLDRHLEQLVETAAALALTDQRSVPADVELDGAAEPLHQLEVDAVGVVPVGLGGAEAAPEVMQQPTEAVVAVARHERGRTDQQPGHPEHAVVEHRQLDVVDLAHQQVVHVDDLPVQQVQDGVEAAGEPVVGHVRPPSW